MGASSAVTPPPTSTRRACEGARCAPLSEEQLRAFLSAAADERLEALFVLAVTTGMRQGELLGLRWRALDLDARSLNVTTTLQRATKGFSFGEPKTKSSRRRIELSRQAIAALRRHRVAQNAERLAARTAWEDLDLVFASEAGRPLSPSELTNVYHRRVVKRAGRRHDPARPGRAPEDRLRDARPHLDRDHPRSVLARHPDDAADAAAALDAVIGGKA